MLVYDVMFWVVLQPAFVPILAREHVVIQSSVMVLRPVERVVQTRTLLILRAQRELVVVKVNLVERVLLTAAVDAVETGMDAPTLMHLVRDMWARKEVVAQVDTAIVVYLCAQLLGGEFCGNGRERRHVKVLVTLPMVVVIAFHALFAVFTHRKVVKLVFVREERSVHRVCQVRAEGAFRARDAFEVDMRAHVRLIVKK